LKNQAFSHSSLARSLLSKDFFINSELIDDEYRSGIVNTAISVSDNLFKNGITLDTIEIGGKTGFSVTNYSEKIILRRCVSNIKSCINIPIKHRNQITKEVIPYLQEGTPYRIYRLDIKSFFESVNIEDVKQELEAYNQLSMHTKNLINAYLGNFNSNFQTGLPRGVEISPILAELIMKPFDLTVSNHREVFYYARFVDDIIIITSSKEKELDFFRWVQSRLLGSLHFNHVKKHIITVKKRVNSKNIPTGIEVANFEYLGYQYTVVDTKIGSNTERVIDRKVAVDLADKKVKQLKEKISKAFYNNHKVHDFPLLKDRLTFLVTNRELKQKKSKRSIPTGVYYNYSAINVDSQKLIELDSFLKSSVVFSRGRLGRLIQSSVTNQQKRELLKLSFVRGFEKRTHKEYSPNRLKEIARIW